MELIKDLRFLPLRSVYPVQILIRCPTFLILYLGEKEDIPKEGVRISIILIFTSFRVIRGIFVLFECND